MSKFTVILFVFLFCTNTYSQSCFFQVNPPLIEVCQGDTLCISASGNLTGTIIEQFDFNTSTMPSGWNASGGASFGQPCGSSLTGTDYYWSSTSGTLEPAVTTGGLDVSSGGVLQFDLVYALQGGASPCEGPDAWDEGVSVQYSIDNGSTWVEIAYFNPDGTMQIAPGAPPISGPTAFTSWGTHCFEIPPGAQTTFTMFRWIQASSMNANFDNWGLDEVVIASSLVGTTLNWSNGAVDTSMICVPISSDTIFTAYLLNSVGDTLYQDQSVITVLSASQSSETVTICPNSNFVFADGTVIQNITSEIVHTSTLQGMNGCDSTIITTVSVLPSYALLDTVMICANDSFTFADGTVVQNITFQITHTSNFQDINSCDSTINTTVNIWPSYVLLDTAMVCANDSFTFADGTVIQNITSEVSHTSTFQDINGCDSTLITTVIPASNFASVTQTDSSLVAMNFGAGVSYSWLDCANNFQALPGETNQTFIPTQAGSYALVVTENGCSDTSSCYTVTLTLSEVNWSKVRIYPNPTKKYFTIDLGKAYADVNVRILDGVGRTVLTESYDTVKNLSTKIDGSAGFYFVELHISDQRFVFTLSKE